MCLARGLGNYDELMGTSGGGGPIADKSKDILYELFSASVRVRACVGVLSAA